MKNPYLVQELWIRLEEGEATFAELASTFGEGPEASKLGVMGPVPLGDVMPSQIAAYLRTLKPGEIHPPFQIAEWHIILRLEHLHPARFDDRMREFLLRKKLTEFIDQRVSLLLASQPTEALSYDYS